MASEVELLLRHFGSQRSKHWFDAGTFRALARLRGIERNAPERYAEAFSGRKVMISDAEHTHPEPALQPRPFAFSQLPWR